MKASFRSDVRETVALKICLMIALAAELELFRLPGNRLREAQQQVAALITEIINNTKFVNEQEEILLDPILGVRIFLCVSQRRVGAEC